MRFKAPDIFAADPEDHPHAETQQSGQPWPPERCIWPVASGSRLAVSTDDPAQVEGFADCLELVAEDLGDTGAYAGRWSGDPARTVARPGR